MNKDTKRQVKVKEKYKLSNWSAYNNSLKQRGSLTIWFEQGLEDKWIFSGKQEPGGKVIYSDIAIEFCLTIRSLYKLAYRQTEGFVGSLLKLSGLHMRVPSYTQCNRRSKAVSIELKSGKENLHLKVDSTGLKVYGEGEWKVRKHGWSKHRTWRKLHIAVDGDSLHIEAVTLTGNDADDASQVKPLLESIDSCVESFAGDGAYDKKKARQELEGIVQQIPPQQNAVIKDVDKPYARQRNEAIRRIAVVGRAGWKREMGYHTRSLAEVTMYRYKTIFSGTLQSRKPDYELKEVQLKCKLLNRMTELGMPKSYKVAI